VLLFLFLTGQQAVKAYWRVEVQTQEILTSALDGDEWSATLPGRFTPRERASGTHWIGGWVDGKYLKNTLLLLHYFFAKLRNI
jgi:hypothetical protein